MSLARERFLTMMALLDAAAEPNPDNLNLDHGRYFGEWDMTPGIVTGIARMTVAAGCTLAGSGSGPTVVTPANPLSAEGDMHLLVAGTEPLDFSPDDTDLKSYSLVWPDISGDDACYLVVLLHGSTHTPRQAVVRSMGRSGTAIQSVSFGQIKGGASWENYSSTISGSGAPVAQPLAQTPVADHAHRLDFNPATGEVTLVDIENPDAPVTVGSATFPVDDLPPDTGLVVTVSLILPAESTSTPPFTVDFHSAGPNQPFQRTALEPAAVPAGAKDGHWLHVTAGGPYGRATTQADDYVCLYGDRQHVMILRLPLTETAVAAVVGEALAEALAEGGEIHNAIQDALSGGLPTVTYQEMGDANPVEGAEINLITPVEGGFEAANNVRIELNDGATRGAVSVRIGVTGTAITGIVPMNTQFMILVDATPGTGGEITALSLVAGDGSLIADPLPVATAKRTRLQVALLPNTARADGGRLVLLAHSAE